MISLEGFVPMALSEIDALRVCDNMMQCHETIRRLFPTDYKTRLAPGVAGIRAVMADRNWTAVEVASSLASSYGDSEEDARDLMWLLASVIEVHAQDFAAKEALKGAG